MSSMTLDCFEFTHQGGREYNEDSVGTKITESGGLFVVADGLGGHLHGDVASKCVVDILTSSFSDAEKEVEVWMTDAIATANEKLLDLQEQNACKMKSTVVALSVNVNGACWANVGDSRLYYIHNCEITSITEDHSVAYKKYKSGQISRAEIAFDEDQSCLLRALGNPDRCQPDVYHSGKALTKGDGFVLCSDGLWEYVFDNEILVDYLKSDCAEKWGQLLLQRAISRVGTDNDNLSLITLIVT